MTRIFENWYADRYSKECPDCCGAQEVAVCTKGGREEHASGNDLLRLIRDGYEIDRFIPCARCNRVGRVPR